MISPSSEEQDRRAVPHNIDRAAAAKAAIGKVLDDEVMGKTPPSGYVREEEDEVALAAEVALVAVHAADRMAVVVDHAVS